MCKTLFSKVSLLFAVVILAVSFSACENSMPAKSTTAEQRGSASVSALTPVEIKEYNGHSLSPDSDLLDVSISGPQNIDITKYKLTVDGLVETPTDFTYDEVLSFPNYTKEVVLNCVEGWSADLLWQGVLLGDLFDKVKLKAEANTVIFHANDGYTTSLPLQTIIDKKIIMAYKVNGIVLPDKDGYPFILIAEDKLGYKWCKWITRIELSSDSSYEGYWESRGYSNDANVTN
jgi:DMSO/TMAO reductase YedYZ molybdopterin-dependent catalytic subunit